MNKTCTPTFSERKPNSSNRYTTALPSEVVEAIYSSTRHTHLISRTRGKIIRNMQPNSAPSSSVKAIVDENVGNEIRSITHPPHCIDGACYTPQQNSNVVSRSVITSALLNDVSGGETINSLKVPSLPPPRPDSSSDERAYQAKLDACRVILSQTDTSDHMDLILQTDKLHASTPELMEPDGCQPGRINTDSGNKKGTDECLDLDADKKLKANASPMASTKHSTIMTSLRPATTSSLASSTIRKKNSPDDDDVLLTKRRSREGAPGSPPARREERNSSGGRRRRIIDEKFSSTTASSRAEPIQPGAIAVSGVEQPMDDDHTCQVEDNGADKSCSKTLAMADSRHRNSRSASVRSSKNLTDKMPSMLSNRALSSKMNTHDQLDSYEFASTPIAAELAPDEDDLDARVEAKLEAQLQQRLQNEVLQRLDSERKKQVIVEAVHVDEHLNNVDLPSNPSEPTVCGFRRKTCLVRVALSLLALIIGIVVGVILRTKYSSSSNSTQLTKKFTTAPVGGVPPHAPTAAPTIAQTIRFQTLLETIGREVSDDIRVFNDRSSPQYTTLEWLANVDPAQLNLTATPATELVERYAMAYLYFSTNGDNWNNKFHFLSNWSVCDWNNFSSTTSVVRTTNSSFDAPVGVMCNTTGVTDIRMGKSFIHSFNHDPVLWLISGE